MASWRKPKAVDAHMVPNINGPMKSGSCQLGIITDNPAASTTGEPTEGGGESAITAEEEEEEKENHLQPAPSNPWPLDCELDFRD